MKTRELIYIVLDLCKNASDDAYLTEEHVQWLLNKNRSFLLKREQERLRREMSQANMQNICVGLEKTHTLCGTQCGDTFLRSVDEIPDMVGTSMPHVYTSDWMSGNISVVPFQKIRYVNFNKYLNNIIFVAIGPDKHVYMKSSNPVFENLSTIRISGIFDDFLEAASMSCDENGQANDCNSFDMEFPIDGYLVPELVDRVLREILGASYRPKDDQNDASDSLSKIANFIRRYVKRPLANQIQGTEDE